MKEARYMVIGRYTEGVNILGYMVQDMMTGNTAICDRKHVELLTYNFLSHISNDMRFQITDYGFSWNIILLFLNCEFYDVPS